MKATEPGTLLLLAAVCLWMTSCASSGSPADSTTDALSPADGSKMTQQELQSKLMAFGDRYFAASLETASILEDALKTPESRHTAAGARLVALTVTTDIAASPNPGGALLDMTVFVTLRRMVWEDYWMPEVYGEAGLPVLDVLIELEEDIWGIAAEVYTTEQLDDLRNLIDDWRALHPQMTAVDFVRLSELGDSKTVQSLIDAGRPGGMLAPVKEANRNLEEMRLLAERLVFMATRMQLMASLQVEMASAKLATQPEIRRLLEDSTTFTDASDRFAEAFATLAADLPEERRAAIDQMLQGLSAERERLLADLGADDGDLRVALNDVRLTLEMGREMADALDEAIRSADALVARTMEGSKTAARPFDILDYQATFAEATVAAREIQDALAAIQHLFGAAGAEDVEPIIDAANRIEEEVIDEIIDRAFLRGVALIVIFFVALALYRLLVRHRGLGPNPQREHD